MGIRPTPWHQRSIFTRGVREPLRRAFFQVLRAAFATEDGRNILIGALDGQLHRRPLSGSDLLHLNDRAYPGIGAAPLTAESGTSRAPIFITARFRTGSTALWNVFRHRPDCTAYYEPLNERRWFDPAGRGTQTDATHRGIDDYWREYDGMEDLARVYRDEFTQRGLYMDRASWNPWLREYISTLIRRAPHTPVLQFNEIDFRLPWMKATFPDARIVHLYRHPRDQWCSTLIHPEVYPWHATLDEFDGRDEYYLRRWIVDLRHTFPFLEADWMVHAYEPFYLIWKLSYAFGRTYADYSVRYEDLLDAPLPQLRRLFDRLHLSGDGLDRTASLIEGARPGRWKDYASAEWFEECESRCEAALREFFDPLLFRAPQAANEDQRPLDVTLSEFFPLFDPRATTSTSPAIDR